MDEPVPTVYVSVVLVTIVVTDSCIEALEDTSGKTEDPTPVGIERDVFLVGVPTGMGV